MIDQAARAELGDGATLYICDECGAAHGQDEPERCHACNARMGAVRFKSSRDDVGPGGAWSGKDRLREFIRSRGLAGPPMHELA